MDKNTKKVKVMSVIIFLLSLLVVFLGYGWYNAECRTNHLLYQNAIEGYQWLRNGNAGVETWDTKEAWDAGWEESISQFILWGSVEDERTFGDCEKVCRLVKDMSTVEWEDENRETVVKKFMELVLSSDVSSRSNRFWVVIENPDVYDEIYRLLENNE